MHSQQPQQLQQQGQQMPIDVHLEAQLAKINRRLKAAKTSEERESVFSDLKKMPHVFHAWLQTHGINNTTMGQRVPFMPTTPQLPQNGHGQYSQHDELMLIDSTLQPQIAKINARMRAAKTVEEREAIFADLKKTPHLFHAWLRVYGNGPYSMMDQIQGVHPMMIPPQPQQLQQQDGSSTGNRGEFQQVLQQAQQVPIDSTLQPQIAEINARMRAAKTREERETVFQELKRAPPLFHAWLRVYGNGPYSMMNLQQPQYKQL